MNLFRYIVTVRNVCWASALVQNLPACLPRRTSSGGRGELTSSKGAMSVNEKGMLMAVQVKLAFVHWNKFLAKKQKK